MQITPPRFSFPVTAAERWFATLIALMYENFGDRFRRARLAAFFAIAEPSLVVGILALVHFFLGARPVYGTSDLLFYTSGILPYYLFLHLSIRTRTTEARTQLPRVTDFDLLISHVINELITKIFTITLIFTGLYLYGIDQAVPVNPSICLAAVGICAMLAVAVGRFNIVIISYFTGWWYIYPIVVRGLLAFAGVVYILDLVPQKMRDIAYWNPISHAITWFRIGLYGHYPHMTLDLNYMFFATAILTILGWLVEEGTREWRRNT
jgi:capsular polysaccharide transport system permease protein